MQLPNPNDGKPFQRIIKDQDGNPLYGLRNEHTKDEEIVFLPSNQSNQQYWQPEVVMTPEGCEHEFKIIDIGKRECECRCGLVVIFHAGINLREENGKASITLNKYNYPLIS